jgi:hypothetical protein
MQLPTEAQWEYACRAGTTTPFHSGPGFPNGTTDDNLVSQIAWFNCNGGCNTHAVGTKAANALGLHDMLGNVWEWQSDWYGDYTSSAQTNPTGPGSGSNRVLRGGAWLFNSFNVRSSNRYYSTPGGTNNLIGTSTMTAPAGATLTNQVLTFINGANETARPVVNAATVYPSFFTTTTYIGAVQNAADTWYTGWTCGLAAGSNC